MKTIQVIGEMPGLPVKTLPFCGHSGNEFIKKLPAVDYNNLVQTLVIDSLTNKEEEEE